MSLNLHRDNAILSLQEVFISCRCSLQKQFIITNITCYRKNFTNKFIHYDSSIGSVTFLYTRIFFAYIERFCRFFLGVPDMAYILEVERYLQPRGVVPKVDPNSRVSIVRWNREEELGKLLVRWSRISIEAGR